MVTLVHGHFRPEFACPFCHSRANAFIPSPQLSIQSTGRALPFERSLPLSHKNLTALIVTSQMRCFAERQSKKKYIHTTAPLASFDQDETSVTMDNNDWSWIGAGG